MKLDDLHLLYTLLCDEASSRREEAAKAPTKNWEKFNNDRANELARLATLVKAELADGALYTVESRPSVVVGWDEIAIEDMRSDAVKKAQNYSKIHGHPYRVMRTQIHHEATFENGKEVDE